MSFATSLLRGSIAVAAIGLTIACETPASAAVITPVSVAATSAYPGYEASNAVDAAANTDWAVVGASAGQYIDLTFATPITISSVVTTDRTTIGNSQGNYGGQTVSFTTQFMIQGFTDSTFTTLVTGDQVIQTVTAPASPVSAADFMTTTNLTSFTTQDLRYTILASNGPGAGLSNITINGTTAFPTSDGTSVPEPATMALLGASVAGIAGFRAKWRKNAQA